MHFDAGIGLIPARLMGKSLELEITDELAIDPYKEVLVEGRGDAARIVIGLLQNLSVLDKIDADEELTLSAEALAGAFKEAHRLGRLKIANRRTGKKSQQWAVPDGVR